MEKLQFKIDINAPKEKVWNRMLNADTYNQWTTVFGEGSHYKGEWKTGSKILFLAPDENGNLGGMVSRIKESRPYEYVSIEHLGVVSNGVEDTTSDFVKDWVGAHENYTFKEKNGSTEVLVDIDVSGEHKDMFNDMWPKALKKLKEIAEK